MSRISGTLKVGEAVSTVQDLLKRQQGSNASQSWTFLIFVLGGLAVGLLANFILVGGTARDPNFGAVGGIIAGACAYLLVRRRLAVSRFKHEFQDRHQTLDLPIRVEISQACLTYEVGGVTQLASWSAVDELFLSHEYWTFHAQNHAMFAPRRLFPSEDAEREFVRLALSHMSANARDRSVDALRFAGTGKSGA